MKLQNLKYFLQESIKSMVKNRLMSIASIITVMGCTLILAISYFLVTNVNQMLAGVERSMSIVAFVEIGADDDTIAGIEAQLWALPYVVGMNFTSNLQAFENMAPGMGLDEALLIGLNEDIFPASFAIEVDNIENQMLVVEEIEAIVGIRGVRHDQELMDNFIGFSQAVTIFGVITIAFLAGISTVIIINTIKITVAARQTEINIMKYVGATDAFIRWPFIMEGILMGTLGAVLALVIGYFLYAYLMGTVGTGTGPIDIMLELAGFAPLSVGEIFVVLAPVTVVTGILIGVVGSATSMRKYLRV